MVTPQHLLTRLEAIGHALEDSGKGLALIGLGSVGQERQRLDEYSDLDFFAIVEPGCKQSFIENLDWLSSICPLAYCFRNTRDGYKLLFEDGVFCEFAVFEPQELHTAAFAPGSVIWKRPDVSEAIAIPAQIPQPPEPSSAEWLLGEALTNLYVGLGRFRRGEKLSAQRFIQHYAVDRLLELAALFETPTATPADPFNRERRFEQRYPLAAALLPQFVPGYQHCPQAALAILDFLDQHFEVNPAIKAEIIRLAQK